MGGGVESTSNKWSKGGVELPLYVPQPPPLRLSSSLPPSTLPLLVIISGTVEQSSLCHLNKYV